MIKKFLMCAGLGVLTGCFLIGCGQNTETPVKNNMTEVSQQVTDKEAEGDVAKAADVQESKTEEIQTVVEEVATVEEDKVQGETTLTYIGHASVKLVAKDGTVLYIDPNWSDGDYSDEADYILVTHGHDDHKPCKAVVLKENGRMITYNESLHDGIYESYDFGCIQVETVAAGGNPNHSIKNCVGYVVTIDGIKVYHAGDTSMIEQMNELADKEIDYAMYPIDGQYNMDAVEATEVAKVVGAKHNIPIHELDRGDTKKSDNFTPDGKLVIEYGETIILGK